MPVFCIFICKRKKIYACFCIFICKRNTSLHFAARYIACSFFMFQTCMERIKIYVRRAKPRHCRWHAVFGRHYFVVPTGTVCIYVCRTLIGIEQAGPPYVRTVPRPGAVRFRSSRRFIYTHAHLRRNTSLRSCHACLTSREPRS